MLAILLDLRLETFPNILADDIAILPCEEVLD